MARRQIGLKVPSTDNAALRAQIATLSDELDVLASEIAASEKKMDDLVAEAFGLTPDERLYIAEDPRKQWA